MLALAIQNIGHPYYTYNNTPEYLRNRCKSLQNKHSEPMTHLGIQLCSNMESTVTANDLELLEKVSYTIY
jgi:hypothetical protein